jgi:hypothetical protein
MQGSQTPNRDVALYDEILELFSDVQLEMVACEMCGSYHPPEIHLAPITAFDPPEPEEA